MKVLDLQCEFQHVFEGWFGSEDDFQSQLARGLVQCPLCGDAAITKRLSAPRLNLGGSHFAARDVEAQQSSSAKSIASTSSGTEVSMPKQELATGPQIPQELIGAWMAMAKTVMANTTDVGDKFAEEARKIHYGESEERGIRGRATRDETEALLDEGIAVMPLFVPEALKGPVQ
jgi:hypothetical protein